MTSLIQQAKQGNPKAIAALINQSLQGKGIKVVKSSLNEGTLQLMLQGEKVPDKAKITSFIRQGLIKLKIPSVNLIHLYAKKTGDRQITWQAKFPVNQEYQSTQSVRSNITVPKTPKKTQKTLNHNISKNETRHTRNLSTSYQKKTTHALQQDNKQNHSLDILSLLQDWRTLSQDLSKNWWILFLILGFFPFTVPYLAWTKTNWNKSIKISITGICILFVCAVLFFDYSQQQKALALVEQAETYISQDQIPQALATLNKAQELNDDRSENHAFELHKKIETMQSRDLEKKILTEMSDADFALLQKGELKTMYIDHTALNALLLDKLRENADQRQTYLAEVRQERIKAQFSAWDGSHINITRKIKERMHDPKSYEHIKTVYSDRQDYLIVQTTFRGKNAFGALVTNVVEARVSLDGENIRFLE